MDESRFDEIIEDLHKRSPPSAGLFLTDQNVYELQGSGFPVNGNPPLSDTQVVRLTVLTACGSRHPTRKQMVAAETLFMAGRSAHHPPPDHYPSDLRPSGFWSVNWKMRWAYSRWMSSHPSAILLPLLCAFTSGFAAGGLLLFFLG